MFRFDLTVAEKIFISKCQDLQYLRVGQIKESLRAKKFRKID